MEAALSQRGRLFAGYHFDEGDSRVDAIVRVMLLFTEEDERENDSAFSEQYSQL